MEDDQALSLNRPESWLANSPGHLWRDKWTALSEPLSGSVDQASVEVAGGRKGVPRS